MRPLLESSAPAVRLRSARVCTSMQMEEPQAVQAFKRRASSFLAGLYVTSALMTGTPAIVVPSYAAKAEATAVEDSEVAAESAGKKAKAASERAKAAKKQLEKELKEADAQAKAEEKAVSANVSDPACG